MKDVLSQAMLCTSISDSIYRMRKGVEMRDVDYSAIEAGANLLKEITEGSILVEDAEPKLGLTPSQKGLDNFTNAIGTLVRIQQRPSKYSDFFIRLYSEMKKLANRESISDSNLDTLDRFFESLSGLLLEDAQNLEYNSEYEGELKIAMM